MKKVLISILVGVSFIFMGCSSKEGALEEDKLENVIVEENLLTKDNEVIYERYKNVDKKNLKYEVVEKDYYFYETENSVVGSDLLDEIPKINDKKYGEILYSYSFSAEINPTLMTYEQAINYAKSLLPDDIKEERIKYDDIMNKFNIVYSSSQGNFILGLSVDSSKTGIANKDSIVGINYLKEI